jgi:hypothetical protein
MEQRVRVEMCVSDHECERLVITDKALSNLLCRQCSMVSCNHAVRVVGLERSPGVKDI